MGIWVTRGELVGQTGEIVGYKTGLALTREEFNDILPPEAKALWRGADEAVLRIRSEEYEHLIATLLYAVGNIESPLAMPPAIATHRRFHDLHGIEEILQSVVDQWVADVASLAKRKQAGEHITSYDPGPLFETIKERHGFPGAMVALYFMEQVARAQHISPWAQMRRIEWADMVALSELFESESIKPSHGDFLDVRFVGYLFQNFDSIDRMHWRKFEALTCQYFNDQGWHIEIGPGRADGGIDARAWLPDRPPASGFPASLLIQCKRRNADVESVVVKALYADVLHERAGGGLVVTTQRLSREAEVVRTARRYPIDVADREALQRWLVAMRKPGSGTFHAG